MKSRIRSLFKRFFSRFIIYKICAGGYRSYLQGAEFLYSPNDFLSFGCDVTIDGDVHINAPSRVILGDGSYIGPETIINSRGGFYLGNYSGLGFRCTVLTVNHQYAGADSIPYGKRLIVQPVHIEDCVWVGANVLILPGVKIGEGAIVGAGSVVAGDVPPLTIVMGNPARKVGSRDKDHFEDLKNKGAFRSPAFNPQEHWIPPISWRKHGELLTRLGFHRESHNDHDLDNEKCTDSGV